MKHMTRFFISLLTLMLLCGALAACAQEDTPSTPDVPASQEHVHASTLWYTNKNDHWQVCSCGIIINKQAHSGGEATHESAATCEICKMKYGEHLHDFGDWKSNGTYHLKKCSCGKESDKGKHTGGTATYESAPICEVCGNEYGEHIHRSTDIWEANETYHWTRCSCGKRMEMLQHTSDEYLNIKTCSVCGTIYGPYQNPEDDHTHTPLSKWEYNTDYHWLYCTTCYNKYDYGRHTGGTATVDELAVCDICGQQYGTLVTIELPNVIQGQPKHVSNKYFYMISSGAKPISNVASNRADIFVGEIASAIYQPIYWIYYLHGLGYTQTVSVTQSQKQRIHFILDGDTFHAEPYYDVQYTAYDKDGNVIEFSEEHGKNPVGDMLKEKFSTKFNITTGKIVSNDTLIMDGSTSTTPLEIAFRQGYYGETEGEATEKVTHSTTYGSFYNLRDGKCDLIFTTPLSDAQREEAQNKGLDLAEVPICMEAFVFVVNANNPVEELTVQQIKDIYSGKITNWKEVGGNDAPIEAFQRNKTSGSQNYMLLFMGDTPLMSPNTITTPHSMQGLVDVLASYDNAINSIGYSVYSYAANMYANAGMIKFIKVNGIAPTEETMADRSYPLLNYNYAIYDKNNTNPEIEKMVDWILSYEGQVAVMEGGYVPINDKVISDYTANTKAYSATGTGPEASDSQQNGYASILEVSIYNGLDITLPENYLTESIYTDAFGKSRPIVFGVQYTLTGLKDKKLEEEINAFIASACQQMEARFYEACLHKALHEEDPYSSAYYSFQVSPNYAHLSEEPSYIMPCNVEIKGQNGYLSVIVSTGFTNEADDGGWYMYFDTVTATYNLKTGKRLTDLSELFPNGVEFVNAVNSELLSDIDTFSGNHYGSIYKFKDGFMALTEAEAKNFTYNSIVFTAGSQVTELGYEASFYADSLATEYCDMSQFFTENFTGYIRDAKKAILLDGEKVISIGGSENAGVYIPSDADAALIKAAEHLAEYMGQFVSEEIALKIYHDAGYTNVVKVEYNFPKFLVSKLGNMFYQFSQFEEEYDNIYYAYDADGNRVFDVNLMVDPWLIDEAKETYYYFQDTGEKVNPSLKEGWEKVSSFVSSDGSGKEWTYDDVAEKLKNITIEDVNFLTGKCYVYLYGDEYKYGRHQITVTIPRDYIILR